MCAFEYLQLLFMSMYRLFKHQYIHLHIYSIYYYICMKYIYIYIIYIFKYIYECKYSSLFSLYIYYIVLKENSTL